VYSNIYIGSHTLRAKGEKEHNTTATRWHIDTICTMHIFI